MLQIVVKREYWNHKPHTIALSNTTALHYHSFHIILTNCLLVFNVLLDIVTGADTMDKKASQKIMSQDDIHQNRS